MLSRIFHRRYFISLSYMLVVVIGIIAWRNISLEMSPDLSLPSITVSYVWGSTSPEVMEQEVTRQVEQAAGRLRDVQKIESITREGRSTVTIIFSREAPVEYRKVELQEYLFALQESLPANVREPSISRRVPQELQDMQTFIVYSLSGERPVRQLLEYARHNIKLPMLGLQGIAEIEVNGARDPALTVEFNTDLLERYNINPRQVLNTLRKKLQWRSSGYADAGGKRISMLVEPQFNNVNSIRQLPLQLPESERIIHLGDVATVEIQDFPAKTLKRINGSPALSINFVKESGADAIRLAEQIRAKMDELSTILPAGMTIQLEQDATEELREQFGNLQYQAFLSLLVVFIVLLLFIRRLRAPFVILGSILFSVLMSVSILYFTGYTLNIITLAGLTIALGMLVDNAVVVFEQVNPGLPDSREARLQHIQEQLPRALVPVLGSTLTTVGIFIPLFFALEELQLFLVPLAVALSLTLLSSVLIALSWIPYSLIWLVPGNGGGSSSRLSSIKNNLFKKTRRYFLGFLLWRHKLRWLFYLGLIAAVGIPLFAIEEPNWDDPDGSGWPEFTQIYFNNRSEIDPWIGGLTYRFFNETYFGSPWSRERQQRIYVSIQTPQGTPLEEIDKMARNFEKIVQPYEEAFSFYETRISEYSGARLVFYIKDEYLTRAEPYIFYAEAMFLAARTGNSAISVYGLGDGLSTGFGGGYSSHRISLTGYSYDKLLKLAKNLRVRLKQNRRVREVDIHGTGWFSRDDLYQYYLELNDEKLALNGLSRPELLTAISLDVNPINTFGQVELAGKQMYLIGRNMDPQNTAEQLMQEKRISESDSSVFSLAAVGELGREKSQSMIRRENQSYFRTVSVDFLGPYRLGREYIEKVVEETPVPVGLSMEFGSGFSFGDDESTKNVLLLLALTILSVWMIVSALLESWLDPLVVILAVPLSLLGIMAGSLFHDLAFDRGAIAGTLLCVGVAVNNAILFMDEKQHNRSKGVHGIRSWLYIYKSRMRTVLITTITTVGGLLPLIIMAESDFWQSLATVVAWGLSTSTLLILLLMGLWEKEKIAELLE